MIGSERGENGEPTAFIVNDTGLPGDSGAGVRHSAEVFSRAWEDRGGRVNVIAKEQR